MKEKKFIKDLSDNEKKEIFDYIVNKFSLENNELSKSFYNSIIEYIKSVRRCVDTFYKNVDEIIELFIACGYDNDQIMQILSKEPSILHENKNDIFYRILILGKVFYPKDESCVRDSYLLQNPRILRTSQEVMYARIKYLESSEGRSHLRHNNYLTNRQITKATHKEFQNSYGISKDELLKKYPFDTDALLDIVSWPENKEILDNIFGRSI